MTLPRILSAAGRTLAVLGAVMLLFVVFQLWGTGLQQAQAQSNLEGDLAERLRQAAAAGQGAAARGADGRSDATGATEDEAGRATPESPGADRTAAAATPPPGGEGDPATEDPATEDPATEDPATEDPAAALPEYPSSPHVVRGLTETAGARSVARLLDPRIESLLPAVYPAGGEAIARITIPAIDVDEIVVAGVEVEDLRKGPGHYSTTPLPGQPGNAAIAGHRTTYGAPFGRLNELRPGHEIIVETLQGRFVYRVLPGGRAIAGRTPGYSIVLPTALEVLDDHGDNRLTLTSCHPKYSSKQRIIVHAALVGDPVVRLPRPGEPIGAEFVQLAAPDDPPRATGTPESPDDPAPAAAGGTDRQEAPAAGAPTAGEPDAVGGGGAAESTGDGEPATPSGSEPATSPGTRPAATAGDGGPVRADPVPDDGFGEGLSGDSDGILPAVLWGLAAAAVWMLGRAFGRQRRRVPTYAIAAVPFLVVLYVMFTYIDRALPAY